MIDDVGERDISGVLQRYMDEVVESREGDDRVIADYLAHFGPNTTGTADPTAALQTAVAQATTPTSRLLLTLVHQLAQRGLIDLEALLGRRS